MLATTRRCGLGPGSERGFGFRTIAKERRLLADIGPLGGGVQTLLEPVRKASPEIELACEVFLQALVDFRTEALLVARARWAPRREVVRTQRGDNPVRLAQQLWAASSAHTWVASDDDQWPFSFVNLCRVFELEPGEVRRQLERG